MRDTRMVFDETFNAMTEARLKQIAQLLYDGNFTAQDAADEFKKLREKHNQAIEAVNEMEAILKKGS